MSDELPAGATFQADDCDACADTEREPVGHPEPPASVPARGAALSVLWWEEGTPEQPAPG